MHIGVHVHIMACIILYRMHCFTVVLLVNVHVAFVLLRVLEAALAGA